MWFAISNAPTIGVLGWVLWVGFLKKKKLNLDVKKFLQGHIFTEQHSFKGLFEVAYVAIVHLN